MQENDKVYGQVCNICFRNARIEKQLATSSEEFAEHNV